MKKPAKSLTGRAEFVGWGTWIRTRTRGVRVHRSTVKLSPTEGTGTARDPGTAGSQRPLGRGPSFGSASVKGKARIGQQALPAPAHFRAGPLLPERPGASAGAWSPRRPRRTPRGRPSPRRPEVRAVKPTTLWICRPDLASCVAFACTFDNIPAPGQGPETSGRRTRDGASRHRDTKNARIGTRRKQP